VTALAFLLRRNKWRRGTAIVGTTMAGRSITVDTATEGLDLAHSPLIRGVAVRTGLIATPGMAGGGGPVPTLGSAIGDQGLVPVTGMGLHTVQEVVTTDGVGNQGATRNVPSHQTTARPGPLRWAPRPNGPPPMQSLHLLTVTGELSCACSYQPRPLHTTLRSFSRRWGRCVM
jgi:hypothetical protein